MAYKRKSIVLNSKGVERVYESFSEWQAKQLLDQRTPDERRIFVGSSVMWRYSRNNVIVTDRATVLSIDGNTLTLQLKDDHARTETADVHEIVSNNEMRLSLASHEIDRNSTARASETSEPASPIDVVS